jgi:hypothetical protein
VSDAMNSIREADWKILRALEPAALDRYCRRVLGEVASVAAGGDGSAHEQYLELWKLLHSRDKDLALAFDDLRRSNALVKIATMRASDMLTDEEFQRFSPETRNAVELILS